MNALRDVRGIAALIALAGGIVSYVALVLNGENDAADKVLVLASSALTFIIGLGSSPQPLDSGSDV